MSSYGWAAQAAALDQRIADAEDYRDYGDVADDRDADRAAHDYEDALWGAA